MIVHYISKKMTSPGVPCRHCAGEGRTGREDAVTYKWRIDCDRCGRAGLRAGAHQTLSAARDDSLARANATPAGWRRELSRDGLEPERHICDGCVAKENAPPPRDEPAPEPQPEPEV